jgi:hypothetical protein
VEAGLGGECGGDLGAAVVVAGYSFAEVVGLDEARRGGAEVCAGEFLWLSAKASVVDMRRDSPNRSHPSPLRSTPSSK